MNESLLQLLNKVTVIDLIIAVTFIIFVFGILSSQKKRISKYLNKWRKRKNDEEDFAKLVHGLKDSVCELQKSVNAINEERIKDSVKITELTKIVMDIDKRDCETERAKIKERIAGIYAECSPNQTCTDMQYETLIDLIREYEKRGGENSFVHSTVEPEMNKWKRINLIKG